MRWLPDLNHDEIFRLHCISVPWKSMCEEKKKGVWKGVRYSVTVDYSKIIYSKFNRMTSQSRFDTRSASRKWYWRLHGRHEYDIDCHKYSTCKCLIILRVSVITLICPHHHVPVSVCISLRLRNPGERNEAHFPKRDQMFKISFARTLRGVISVIGKFESLKGLKVWVHYTRAVH